VPVGVADPEDLVTVAVKVTGFPSADGFGQDLSAVVVAIGALTTWETVFDVLPEKSVGAPW
jgi:hypothetical protein